MDDLPDWVPAEEWQEFRKMRKKIRKPMTQYAEKLMLCRLFGLICEGYSAEKVLQQSIVHCWLNIYPLKEKEDAGIRKSAHDQRTERNLREAKESLGLFDSRVVEMRAALPPRAKQG